MNEWREVTVEEIAAPIRNALVGGPFGSNLVSRDYMNDGIPVIRGQNMGNRWVSGNFVFVTEEKAHSLEANLARPGDIIFTQRGTLGQVSLIPETPFECYLVSQSQMKLTVDQNIADPRFFYYVFSSNEQQDYIRQHAIQTGVPHTNLGILRATPVPLPPLTEQRAIAHILGTLDDKIELNRRMSETLEAMARAIFKSWFVDFDPVREKMKRKDAKTQGRKAAQEILAFSRPGDFALNPEIADLFPDGFVDSELGEIPEGWEVGEFGNFVELLRDQVNPQESPDTRFQHFSIPSFDDGQWPKDEFGEPIKSQKSRVLPGVVLLSKLNPEIERVWMVDVERDSQAVCSTEFLVMRPLTPAGRGFVYCLARAPQFRRSLEGLVTGTSKSHQRVQSSSLLTMQVVCPSLLIVKAFERQVAPMLERSLACRRESRTLVALRDALLPKLISGELRVKNAERFNKN